MTQTNSSATTSAPKEQGELSQAERLAKAKAAAARAKAIREQMKSKNAQASDDAKAKVQSSVDSKDATNQGSQGNQGSDASEQDIKSKSQDTNATEATGQGQAKEQSKEASSSSNEATSTLASQDPGKEKLAEKLAQARKLRDAARAKAAQDSKAVDSSKDSKQKSKEQKQEDRAKPTLVSSLDDIESIEGVKEQVYTKAKQPSLWEIFIRGIWKDNPGLCQLLGMCPLLAVTTSAANALGLGMATIVVMVLSSMVISLLRKFIMSEVRIPLYVVIIATLVTVVRIEVEAYFPSLYQQLGIYLSLIVTNCIIMARAEAFAGKNNIIRSTVDAIACSIGFTIVLFALGCVREIIGNGTLFMGAADVLGAWAQGLETQVISADKTLLTAILPPGGFFILALFIAGKNFLDGLAKRRAERKLEIKVLNI